MLSIKLQSFLELYKSIKVKRSPRSPLEARVSLSLPSILVNR